MPWAVYYVELCSLQDNASGKCFGLLLLVQAFQRNCEKAVESVILNYVDSSLKLYISSTTAVENSLCRIPSPRPLKRNLISRFQKSRGALVSIRYVSPFLIVFYLHLFLLHSYKNTKQMAS